MPSSGSSDDSHVVEPRQTLPILANVLIESEETRCADRTDLEVGARVSVPAKVLEDGSITLSARKAARDRQELPSAALTLRVQTMPGSRCAAAAAPTAGGP